MKVLDRGTLAVEELRGRVLSLSDGRKILSGWVNVGAVLTTIDEWEADMPPESWADRFAQRTPEAELRSLLDEVETLCEDNGQNAILVEDLAALIRDRRATLATPDPSWTEDAEGYLIAPLVNRGTLDAG